MELVSVVIPVYNVEPYLGRCVDSIINQTYKNLEIILVDDGSTDNSGKICDDYQSLDERICVIHKSNGGLSDARNSGLYHATGKYIAFIDSDDFIEQDFISILYQAIIENDADISICDYIKGTKNYFPRQKGIRKVSIFTSEQMLKQWHGEYKHVETMAWNKLYKRRLFIDNNILYPYGYYNEDVQTTHLVVEVANKIVIVNYNLYYYYQRKDSITGMWSNKKISDNINSQKVRLRFFKKNRYMNAYERLFIKYQKFYILAYFHSAKSMREKLAVGYLLNYKKKRDILHGANIQTWEHFLLWSFKNYFKLKYERRFIFGGRVSRKSDEINS